MKPATNLLLLEQNLSKAFGMNTLIGFRMMKTRLGEEFLFSQSRTCFDEPESRFTNYDREILENVISIFDDSRDKVVLQIAMAELEIIASICETIWSKVKESKLSLILVVKDYSTFNLAIGNNPIKKLSSTLGLSFSQHPNCPSVFLVDFEYRFHERFGRVSRYCEITKLDQLIDDKHQNILLFRMEGDFVKKLSIESAILSEEIRGLNNYSEIYSRLFDSISEKISICSDETGVYFRRPYIEGSSLREFLEDNSSESAAKLLIQTSCHFSKMKYFPNDLRPWNLIYNQSQCFFIDFPKNIYVDDDVDGIPNFISLLIVLQHLGEFHTQPFEMVQSKILYDVCNHAEIYNFNSFAKLELAWLNLQEYVDLLMLFKDGKMSIEMILNQVLRE